MCLQDPSKLGLEVHTESNTLDLSKLVKNTDVLHADGVEVARERHHDILVTNFRLHEMWLVSHLNVIGSCKLGGGEVTAIL